MLFTGGQVPHHWTWTTLALDIQVGAAVVLVVGLAALLLFGNRNALRTSARQLWSLRRDDRAWLSPLRILAHRLNPLDPARATGHDARRRRPGVGATPPLALGRGGRDSRGHRRRTQPSTAWRDVKPPRGQRGIDPVSWTGPVRRHRRPGGDLLVVGGPRLARTDRARLAPHLSPSLQPPLPLHYGPPQCRDT